MEQKRINACTTTLAAKHVQQVQSVEPGVLLVEEAGEILESRILAALGPKTSHGTAHCFEEIRGIMLYGATFHIQDSLAEFYLEGSECCLIHADNSYSPQSGVWLKPRLRAGYDKAACDAVRLASRS